MTRWGYEKLTQEFDRSRRGLDILLPKLLRQLAQETLALVFLDLDSLGARTRSPPTLIHHMYLQASH